MLVSLLTILLGFNHLRHFYQITLWSGPNDESNTQVKVMSYNVRLFDLYNWAENRQTRNEIFKLLVRENAGIYCFQEFYVREDGAFNTRDTLKSLLKIQHVHEGYTHYIPNGKQSFGLATFSVYPIVKKEMIHFKNDDNNCMIVSDIKINEDTIRVINAHLASIRFQKADYEYMGDEKSGKQWYKFEVPEQRILTRLKNAFVKRVEQVTKLNEIVSQSTYPVIVCGDFNDTPISYAYRIATQNLKDAFVESGNGIGNTYIGKFPSFRIDYILHSESLHSYAFQTLPEVLSDHHPIECMIEIEKNN